MIFSTIIALGPDDNPTIPLEGEADSGLRIDYEVVEGPATIEDGQLVVNGYGTVIVRASQAGNKLYKPSGNVESTIKAYSPYNWWRLQNFGSDAEIGDSGSLKDPDKDSLDNIYEYFLGTSPKDFTALPFFETAGQDEDFYLETRQSSGSLDGLTVVTEVSTDLSNWTEAEDDWVDIAETENGDVLYKLNAGMLPPHTFIRLRVNAL